MDDGAGVADEGVYRTHPVDVSDCLIALDFLLPFLQGEVRVVKCRSHPCFILEEFFWLESGSLPDIRPGT